VPQIIYYLSSQLGFSINSIVGAGANTLGKVYRNLTGDAADPFPFFKQLADMTFPGTLTITCGNIEQVTANWSSSIPLLPDALATTPFGTQSQRTVTARCRQLRVQSGWPTSALKPAFLYQHSA
jgi:hypothetical protein